MMRSLSLYIKHLLDRIYFFKSAEDKKENLDIADIKSQIAKLQELMVNKKNSNSEKGKNKKEEIKQK